MHSKCFKEYAKTNTVCPLCKKFMFNKSLQRQQSSHIEQQIAMTPMPEDYRNKIMAIQCNDCLERSEVPFHIFGGKCSACGNFNTTQLKEPLREAQMNQDLQPPDSQPMNAENEWEDVDDEEAEEE